MDNRTWQRFLRFGGPAGDNCAEHTTILALEKYLPVLAKNALVADIGAGGMTHSLRLVKLGYKVIAVDPRYPGTGEKGNLTAIPGDMHELPIGSGTIDLVFANHVWEHSIAPLIALAEFNRVLKPDGFLFLGLPDHVEKWVKDHYSGHVFVPTELQIENLMDLAGFSIMRDDIVQENGDERDFMRMRVVLCKKTAEFSFPPEAKSYEPTEQPACGTSPRVQV